MEVTVAYVRLIPDICL